MKIGAGCIVLSKKTGRILLSQRSKSVKFSGTWSTWGGWINYGELPIEGAKREFIEETEYHGETEIFEISVYQKKNFEYHNYLLVVEEEFEPTINWETSDFRWVNIENLPQPLHFGLKWLFENRFSILEDLLEKIKIK